MIASSVMLLFPSVTPGAFSRLLECPPKGGDSLFRRDPVRDIDLPMVRSASWLHDKDLLNNEVKIYEYTPTMMHNKAMVVDGIYSTIGSMNKNAEESLAELVFWIWEPY